MWHIFHVKPTQLCVLIQTLCVMWDPFPVLTQYKVCLQCKHLPHDICVM